MSRLIELQPKWLLHGLSRRGLVFLCPHCRSVKLTCFFEPTPQKAQFQLLAENGVVGLDEDGDPLRVEIVPCNPSAQWNIESGETFDGLSISPSIDASASGHWHGHIRSGVAK